MELLVHPTAASVSAPSSPWAAGPDLDRLAATVAGSGVAAIAPTTLSLLAGRARAVGVSAAVVDVLVDRTAPEVVRTRAFARIHRHLAAPPVHPIHRAAA